MSTGSPQAKRARLAAAAESHASAESARLAALRAGLLGMLPESDQSAYIAGLQVLIVSGEVEMRLLKEKAIALELQAKAAGAMQTALAVQASALNTQVIQRTQLLETTRSQIDVATGQVAARMHHFEIIALAQREVLSPAEEVLSIPFLSQRSVMSFLRQEEVLPLRFVSVACRDAIAEHAWDDLVDQVPPVPSVMKRGSGSSRIKGSSLASWRRCFPHATAANVLSATQNSPGYESRNEYHAIPVAELVHLRGIRKLVLRGCGEITDAGLAHLSGIHTLNMADCTRVTDAGLAHLSGIHTLSITGCPLITNAGLMHLRGVRKLHIAGCTRTSNDFVMEGATITR